MVTTNRRKVRKPKIMFWILTHPKGFQRIFCVVFVLIEKQQKGTLLSITFKDKKRITKKGTLTLGKDNILANSLFCYCCLYLLSILHIAQVLQEALPATRALVLHRPTVPTRLHLVATQTAAGRAAKLK